MAPVWYEVHDGVLMGLTRIPSSGPILGEHGIHGSLCILLEGTLKETNAIQERYPYQIPLVSLRALTSAVGLSWDTANHV